MNRGSREILERMDRWGAHNYLPLPIVISRAEGIWVEDPEGNRYMDMLSAYSALNQGHRHPKIIEALVEQAQRVTLTSRAFHHDRLDEFYEKVVRITGKERVLPMNTGAEAVETAIKAVRRWGYEKKNIPHDQAEIIAAEGNFHGRTLGAVSMSSEAEYKRGFGPMLPGIKLVPYGDVDALEQAITPRTAGVILEPIQGEAGIVIPPKGYLQAVSELCRKHRVLFVADEIQSGLARTGQMFACDWEGVIPDIYILGKALGGGVIPVSCIAADSDIMEVFDPGSHGSTFGGNPLASAVAVAALNVIEEEDLVRRSRELGEYLVDRLKQIQHPAVKEVRGRGLFVGMELHEPARPYCEKLKEEGMLCKETHEYVIRFAPPLIIKKEELDFALGKIYRVFAS